MAHDDRRAELELVHQRDDVLGEFLDAVAAVGLRRLTVASQGHGDGADVIRQAGEHGLERAPGVRDSVEHHDGDAPAVAAFYVGQPDHFVTSGSVISTEA
jgi:hypothetical protein